MFNILLNPTKAERHPLEIMLVGMFYSALSIILGLWVFGENSSLAIVFLTVVSSIYLIQGAIKIDEKQERNWDSEKFTLTRHKKTALLILFLFFGFVITFSLFSLFLPSDVSSNIFSLQTESVEQIQLITGNATSSSAFWTILTNNLNVVLISLIFSLFYGAGVIYILTWNASVMGFVIGNVARETLGLVALPVAFLKYFLHGIPEMFAYILAAIAGTIIYLALIKDDFAKVDRNKRLIIDIVALIGLAILILVGAALLEVFVSPLI